MMEFYAYALNRKLIAEFSDHILDGLRIIFRVGRSNDCNVKGEGV